MTSLCINLFKGYTTQELYILCKQLINNGSYYLIATEKAVGFILSIPKNGSKEFNSKVSPKER